MGAICPLDVYITLSLEWKFYMKVISRQTFFYCFAVLAHFAVQQEAYHWLSKHLGLSKGPLSNQRHWRNSWCRTHSKTLSGWWHSISSPFFFVMDKKNAKQQDLGICSALKLGGSLLWLAKSSELARSSAGRGIFCHRFAYFAQAHLSVKEPT